MYFAANDVIKVAVTALLVGQAVAVPVPNQGAVDVLEARDVSMLMARDPRRGFGSGFSTGLRIWDAIRGNSNNKKRDLDEVADEEASGMIEARDPRRGFGSGFSTGLRIWDAIRGNSNNQKRDLDEVADEEASGMLEARDPRRGFGSGFRTGLRIWDAIRGGGSDNSQSQKRDLIDEAPEYEEAAEEFSDLEARDVETLEARDPKFSLKSVGRLGKKIWQKIKGGGGGGGGVPSSNDDNQQQEGSS